MRGHFADSEKLRYFISQHSIFVSPEWVLRYFMDFTFGKFWEIL